MKNEDMNINETPDQNLLNQESSKKKSKKLFFKEEKEEKEPSTLTDQELKEIYEEQKKQDKEDAIKRLRYRKRFIRRFAILFFVVLLILTFFSNTIMNYSLPEISTVNVQSGSVSSKVRCQGTVEVSDKVDVEVSGNRVVKEVLVQDGDTVKEGDVIMTFEETENTDLQEAEESLQDQEDNYTKTLLGRNVNDYSAENDAITAAKEDLAAAQTALETAKSNESALSTAQSQKDSLQASIDEKEAQIKTLKSQRDSYNIVLTPTTEAATTAPAPTDGTDQGATSEEPPQSSGEFPPELNEIINQLATAEGELSTLQSSLEEIEAQITELSAKGTVAEAEADVLAKTRALATAQKALTDKQRENSKAAQVNAIDDASSQRKIEQQKEKVEKLKASDDFKEIRAMGDGVISGITAQVGDKLTPDAPIASIQLTDGGYEVSCQVKINQAKELKVGNEAEIENVWDDSVSSSIRSIKADPSNPNQNSIVKFSVKGNVQVGETLMFSVGDKTGKYETIVPNSAIREDSDGKYVYIAKTRATPLGNRYFAKKVKVDVLASDTKSAAVQGEIDEYANVIVNSSKPLDDGQQVRLADQ